MTNLIKTALVTGVIVAASATASFAATTGGTTLAGMHNGAQAKHKSTMQHHRYMKRRGMTKRSMSHKGM